MQQQAVSTGVGYESAAKKAKQEAEDAEAAAAVAAAAASAELEKSVAERAEHDNVRARIHDACTWKNQCGELAVFDLITIDESINLSHHERKTTRPVLPACLSEQTGVEASNHNTATAKTAEVRAFTCV